MRHRTNHLLVLTTPLLLALCNSHVQGQGLNNLWMGGYGNEHPAPWGAVDLDFMSGNLVISTPLRTIEFGRTSANITDANGELLFSTNGAYIANVTGDAMLNGTGLNPSFYTSDYPDGLHLPQSVLILPKPDAPDIYYLIHGTYDDPILQCAQYLYLTTIDMGLDGGLGGVVSMNQVLIADNLNIGKITAVRHANGRDWWVFCQKVNTNIFYRLLVTPYGISEPDQQAIGIIRHGDAGQVCFSPDGGKFAYYWGTEGENEDLEIFDFDRCTGLLSDPVQVGIQETYDIGMGVAFSSNSRFLYVSAVADVYQLDMEAADIPASMAHIANWDSTYSPYPPLATMFGIAQLAPDGKIYIATGNGTDVLHVVHLPDSAGKKCDMEPHGITLPRLFFNSLPNHPNYHLGPVDGSACDSLGINNGLQEDVLAAEVRVYPNPGTGTFTFSYPALPTVGVLELRDLAGRLVLREGLPAWSQQHQVELNGRSAGMYQCAMRWAAQQAGIRIILAP